MPNAMRNYVTIATWLVLDDVEHATEFPSAGSNSASPAVQLVYWHCVALYFLSCRLHNTEAKLTFYTNADVTSAAPASVHAMLARCGVTIRRLDITFRLPQGCVRRWGNQFFVLDIIRDFARNGDADALVLTDSDCIWRRSATELVEQLETYQCLLYTLEPADQTHYEVGKLLNGMTHKRMSEIARSEFELPSDHSIQYHGGEFFAATRAFCSTAQPAIDRLWRRACLEAEWPDSIKEEAHLLSILAEGLGSTPRTANRFVRRIWTNFEAANARRSDLDLMLWHLPSEKQYGFRRLWRHLNANVDVATLSVADLDQLTAHYMGIPRRSTGKLVLDVAQKVTKRAARARDLAHATVMRHASPAGDRNVASKE